MILVFDIGGTSVKFAIIDKDRNFIVKSSMKYGFNNELIEANNLLDLIKKITKNYLKDYPKIKAICISTCGIIKEDGTIWGSYAIKNYSQINWKKDLKEFNLPIYVENDAKCSLLAEYQYGVGKGYSTLIGLVFGTGVGGAIIMNNQLLKGINGEFGCFWEDKPYQNFSTLGSPRNAEITLNQIFNVDYNFNQYLEIYNDESLTKLTLDNMIFMIAKNILNISFVINPEIFIIGGGISENEWFIKKIQDKVKELIKLSGFEQTWKIVPAQFGNDANLLGAYSLAKEVT